MCDLNNFFRKIGGKLLSDGYHSDIKFLSGNRVPDLKKKKRKKERKKQQIKQQHSF